MKPSEFQMNRIKTVLQAQFLDLDIDQILGETDISVSRKTRRIREINDISETKVLLFTLRTSDGRYIPTYEAGKRMLESGYWNNIVVMEEEAGEFVRKGKSAFCKHVLEVHGEIQPLSEVLLINKNKELLAVGSAVQPGYAMLQLNSGIAVKPKGLQKL